MAQPKLRPIERFWPYAELPEQLSVEEQAALDPDLYEAVHGHRPERPFSITLVFPDLEVPGFARALELAKHSSEFRETGEGPLARHRARFQTADAAQLREVFNVVGQSPQTEILVDDRPLPYGRELWIPLVGFFINA